MTITAKEVAKLREMTGAGMMACKNALIESDGDYDKAIDILRKQGAATAAKKAGRVASEGAVSIVVAPDEKSAAMVEVNCESDFVAKSDVFVEMCKKFAGAALAAKCNDVEKFGEVAIDGSNVATVLTDAVGKIGEKLSVRRVAYVENSNGHIGSYIHMGGAIGVLVNFDTDVVNDAVKEMAHDVAMNVAAFTPAYNTQADVPAEVLEHEKGIITEQLKADPKMSGKPDAVLDKIAQGKLGKFYEENCAVEQIYAKEPSLKIKQLIENTAKTNKANIEYKAFTRFIMGEGLEKRHDDLAAEVEKIAQGK